MTVAELAKIIAEEFERDGWGDVDPYLFRMVADDSYADTDQEDDAEALETLLERVVERLGSSS